MESPTLGKETGAKLGIIQRVVKLLRMHSGSSPFTGGKEDSDREFTCILASPDYQRQTEIATLNAELRKGEAQMEWQRRSQSLR